MQRAPAIILSLFLLGGFGFSRADEYAEMARIRPETGAAEQAYRQARLELDSLKSQAVPMQDQARDLKQAEEKSPSWFRRWRIQRLLNRLQSILTEMQRDESAVLRQRDLLFGYYSAMDEELNSLADKSLSRLPGLSGDRQRLETGRLAEIIRQKKTLADKIAGLDFGSESVFPLAALPQISEIAPSQDQIRDRLKVLQAREIQMEAWADLVDRDLRLHISVLKTRMLPARELKERVRDLRRQSARIRGLCSGNLLDLERCQRLLAGKNR